MWVFATWMRLPARSQQIVDRITEYQWRRSFDVNEIVAIVVATVMAASMLQRFRAVSLVVGASSFGGPMITRLWRSRCVVLLFGAISTVARLRVASVGRARRQRRQRRLNFGRDGLHLQTVLHVLSGWCQVAFERQRCARLQLLVGGRWCHNALQHQVVVVHEFVEDERDLDVQQQERDQHNGLHYGVRCAVVVAPMRQRDPDRDLHQQHSTQNRPMYLRQFRKELLGASAQIRVESKRGIEFVHAHKVVADSVVEVVVGHVWQLDNVPRNGKP
jgi:hypothetical protein